MDLELRYGRHLIGIVEGAFWSDNTGFGVFHSTSTDEPDIHRVREYVAFSEEWHERMRADKPHNPHEFNVYRDVYESESWHTVFPDGSTAQIRQPVFMQGEITWQPAPTVDANSF